MFSDFFLSDQNRLPWRFLQSRQCRQAAKGPEFFTHDGKAIQRDADSALLSFWFKRKDQIPFSRRQQKTVQGRFYDQRWAFCFLCAKSGRGFRQDQCDFAFAVFKNTSVLTNGQSGIGAAKRKSGGSRYQAEPNDSAGFGMINRCAETVDGKSGGFFDFYCIPIAVLRVDDEVCHSSQISDFVKGRGWGKVADKNRLRFQKICCRCASAFSY